VRAIDGVDAAAGEFHVGLVDERRRELRDVPVLRALAASGVRHGSKTGPASHFAA
jgi:hypothetical protein